jgi:iron complex outermembrane receptor protein
VTVTALRRETTVLKAPAAITAVSGAALQTQQITSLASLAPKIPSLQFGQIVSGTQISLRGVSLSSVAASLESPIAIHEDGVYLAEAVPLDVLFMDVADVEVLRGPQGTLYGRNATGGSINFIPNRPTDDFSGYVNLTYGNYNSHREEAAISGPLTNGVDGRIYILNDERDSGYLLNVANGQKMGTYGENGGRASLRFEPASQWKIDLSGFYFHRNGSPGIYDLPTQPIPASEYALNPGFSQFPVSLNPRSPSLYSPGSNSQVDDGGLLSIAWTPSSLFGFESHTSYTEISERVSNAGASGTGIPTITANIYSRSRSVQEDAAIKGTTPGSALDWIVGGSYADEKLFSQNAYSFYNPQGFVIIGPAKLPSGFRNGTLSTVDTKSTGLYGDLTWHLVSKLDLYGGVRWSEDRRDATFDLTSTPPGGATSNTCSPSPLVASTTSSDVTGKAGLEYHVSDQSQVYGQWQQGFKSGGFNPTTCGATFKPEQVNSYEIGYKAVFWDGRANIRVAAFHYDYVNMQILEYIGISSKITNAGASSISGAEFEGSVRPIPALNLDAAVSWLPDARYVNFFDQNPLDLAAGTLNLAGARLSLAPRYTADVGAEYTFDLNSGDLTLRGEVYANGSQYIQPYNLAATRANPYVDENLFLTYKPKGGHWTARAWVRNLGNEVHLTSGAAGTTTATWLGSFSMPRTFGVGLGYRW